MVCPWYAYSQTMISEVSPLPQMFLFFALFSVIGKTSAFIGPFVSSAIITAAGDNDNMPFAFLFALGCFSTIFLYFLDVKKSRIECEVFVNAEAERAAFVPGTGPDTGASSEEVGSGSQTGSDGDAKTGSDGEKEKV